MKLKILFCFSFLMFSILAFGGSTTERTLIQFNGKYLPLSEVAKEKGINVIQHQGTMSFRINDKYFPVNSEYIQILIKNVKKLSLNFNNTFINAKIYLDNFNLGNTDDSGNATFNPMYPETGFHKLTIVDKVGAKHPFNFNLSKASTLKCSGTEAFRCELTDLI